MVVVAGLSPLGAGASEDLVLVEVNGEPITGADLDRMIVEAHRGGGMTEAQSGDLVPKLLEKAIRDQLILQDAWAMGMYEDPSVSAPVDEKVRNRVITLYAREHVELPEVTDEEKQGFFLDYYHRIQVRQVSLPTEKDCRDAISRIESGEVTMGTLAVERSLDTYKARGGLHGEKYWADFENLFRDAVRGLDIGDYSKPFPLNDVWSFVRVESRRPADASEFERFEVYIESVLRNQKYEKLWAGLIADREAQVEFTVDEKLLDAILADAEGIYRGEFRRGSGAPVIGIGPGHAVTEREFRVAMSKQAMEMGESSNEEVLAATLESQRELLVLVYFAEKEGWFESAEVVEYRERELDQAVLNAYLVENVHNKVFVEREEFEAFYEEHKEDFRGPEEVRLSFFTTMERSVVDEFHQRLAGGADFDYLRAEIEGRDITAYGESPSWGPVTFFSANIVDALHTMEVGDTSGILPFTRGWLVFRLDGRREGSIASIAEVETSIRQALYLREFTRILDEHLSRLEEVSEIVRHDDRIETWAGGGR
jgi:parvulin-like peptidyl-prolyl isomerase